MCCSMMLKDSSNLGHIIRKAKLIQTSNKILRDKCLLLRCRSLRDSNILVDKSHLLNQHQLCSRMRLDIAEQWN